MHFGNAGDRRNNRDRCLSPTGHHIDIVGVKMFFEIDHRHTVGANCCRGQIDDLDVRFDLAQPLVIDDMRTRRRCVKDNVDILEPGQFDQALHTVRRGGDAKTLGASESVRRRVDADHRAHFEVRGVAHDFDHQVRADIAGTDDCGFQF